MIFTCTLNPAIDKIGHVDKIQVNQVNRLMHVESDAGGKGINVSRDIKILNHKSIAVGFLGGTSGTTIDMMLKRENIDTHMIDIIGNTRTNLKIIDENGVSEFNEEGPFILHDELEALFDFFRGSLDCRSVLVISGSLPKGCSDSTYQKLCEIAHENGAKVFMDTSFKLLEPALCEKPEIIKISSYDLARYNHIDAQLKEEEIKTMGKQFLNQYCDYLCVSTENNGIYLLTKDKTYHCAALDLKIKSRVGVGDAFVAGFVVGLDVKTNDSDALRLAGACYAAASQRINAHPKSYYEISSYLDEIQIYEI